MEQSICVKKEDRNRVGKYSAFLLVLLVMIGVFLFGGMWLNRPFFNGGPTTIIIKENTSFNEMCQSLSVKCARMPLMLFRRLCIFTGFDRKMLMGSYSFTGKENFYSVFHTMTRGIQTPIQLVIHNIRTPEELAGCLGRQLMADSAKFLNLLEDDNFCGKHGFTKENIRCMFLPNTYEVYYTTSPQMIFERMHVEYDAFWNEKRQEQLKKLNISQTDAIIIASITEEESNNKNEMGIICGLYYNRLKKGMPMQACPTIKYALGKFNLRHVLYSHLKVDSPYNTYVHLGLPPGPIRIPEGSTIDALLYHTPHNYLFMCADADRPGWHRFSSTAREHESNASRYHAKMNRKGR